MTTQKAYPTRHRFPLVGVQTPSDLERIVPPSLGGDPVLMSEITDATSPLYAAHLAHLEALRRQRRQPATMKVYRIYVGGYLRFLDDRLAVPSDLSHLNSFLVGEYQDWVSKHSRGTRDGASAEHQAVRLLKIFSRWLWRRGFLESDTLARVEPPRLTKLHRAPFSESEVRRLLEAARLGPNPFMERALLLLGLDTGARIGELCSIEFGDLDLDEGAVLFRKTKTGRPRRVFFRVPTREDGGPCVAALRDWLAVRRHSEAPTVFIGRDGGPLSTDTARRIYRSLGASAGVPRCHPHRGRHTAATEFLAELPGAELHLRNRLGHLSAEVLSDYVTVSDTMARHVAETASISAKWNL